MAKIENDPKWICDRCKVEHIGENPPNVSNDAWGTLMIDQDAGWDYAGSPWTPRMRDPIQLCGDCIEEIVLVVNNQKTRPINIVFDGPPSHESGRFIEVETDDGKGISAGEWIERDDGLWALRITKLPKEK